MPKGNPMDFLARFKGRENIYFDGALAGQGTIKAYVDQVGMERVLFGSDVSFETMKDKLRKVLSLKVGDREMENILGGNLKRMTGLERE